MPIEIHELDNGLGNIIIAEGHLSSKDFYTAISEHLSKPDEQLRKYIYSIGDYTNVSNFQLNLSYIRKIATQSIEVSKINPHVIVALAAKSSITYGLARIFISLVRASGWNIKLFKNRNDLDKWLHLKIKEIYGNIDLKYDT